MKMADLQVAYGGLDRGASREDAMVLQDEGAVLVAQRLGNVVALLVGEYNTSKVFVQSTLAVKSAAVLRRDLNCSAKRSAIRTRVSKCLVASNQAR